MVQSVTQFLSVNLTVGGKIEFITGKTIRVIIFEDDNMSSSFFMQFFSSVE